MSFVSYAQNFEDVILWRALKHIKNGVYVDVGAQHPVLDSVSNAFYEHGWRGLHVEPVPAYAQLLRDHRPDETVLQVALADKEGTIELHVFPNTGLSTAIGTYADNHQKNRGFEQHAIQVPLITLTTALQPLLGKDIHWLKIDVEGFEEQVLNGWDSHVFRPWIMVVEATVPGSPEVDCAKWDPILIEANYKFVYFDGLNRFYVAQEHPELFAAFECPPNIFDLFQLTENSNFCFLVVSKLKQDISALENELQSVYASRSWRVTRPLRKVISVLKKMRSSLRNFVQYLISFKQKTKSFIKRGLCRLYSNASLRAMARAILIKCPRLKPPLVKINQYIRVLYLQEGKRRARLVNNFPTDLSSRANRVYIELKKRNELRKN